MPSNPPPLERDALVALAEKWLEREASSSFSAPVGKAYGVCARELSAAMLAGASGGAEQCSLDDGCWCSACVREAGMLAENGSLKLTRYGRAAYAAGRQAGGAGEAQPGSDRCPSSGATNCPACSGEYCERHGNRSCECGPVERHWSPAPAPVREPEPCDPCLIDRDPERGELCWQSGIEREFWCGACLRYAVQPSPQPPAERSTETVEEAYERGYQAGVDYESMWHAD